tara:strand:- start:79 stop:474 length:396 start_codon:yes stop_codon:yes gene_type:complete
MSAGKFDITIEEGTDFNLKLDYKDSNDATIDLSSGFNARMQIRESIGGTLIAWGSSSTDVPSDDSDSSEKHVIVTMGDSAPNIDISIAYSYTVDYTASQFEGAVYEVELFTSSTVDRVMEGSAHLVLRVIT